MPANEFTVSEAWKKAYPGAAVGILALRSVAIPQRSIALEEGKKELQRRLRSDFSGYDRAALKALPVLKAYNQYYKRYKKTYHVQLQLESVVLKGKPISRAAALIEALFMAELKNLLLTAGHDMRAVQNPVGIDVANGRETYIRIDGQEQRLKQGDMFIADAQGVISSVLYGPDRRTQIVSGTRQTLFTVYAPPGIGEEAVYGHLQDIRANVLLVSPEAKVETLNVYGTG